MMHLKGGLHFQLVAAISPATLSPAGRRRLVASVNDVFSCLQQAILVACDIASKSLPHDFSSNSSFEWISDKISRLRSRCNLLQTW